MIPRRSLLPDFRSTRARVGGDMRVREIRWCWLLAQRQRDRIGYRIDAEAFVARLHPCVLARERARSRIVAARLRRWSGLEWPKRFGPAAELDLNALAEPPAEELLAARTVRLRLGVCSEPVEGPDGCRYSPEELPGLPVLLIARVHEWNARYQWWGDETHASAPPECDPRFPAAASNREGCDIADALEQALPPGWTVQVDDVDAWLRRVR